MDVEGVHIRIGEIRARMTQLACPAVRPGEAAGQTTVGAAGGSRAASGAEFAQVLDAAMRTPAGTGWERPVDGRVTSGFGPRWGRQHAGVDIAAATGTPVRAAAAGVVRTASWHGGYGNLVIIDHGDGTSTRYGHNSRLLVGPGDQVASGQPVAQVGSTGRSTGPHLHFEVRVNDRAVDPRTWLQRHGVAL